MIQGESPPHATLQTKKKARFLEEKSHREFCPRITPLSRALSGPHSVPKRFEEKKASTRNLGTSTT